MGKARLKIDYEYLKDNFVYDSTVGKIYRKKDTHRSKVGDEVGYLLKNNYKRVYRRLV